MNGKCKVCKEDAVCCRYNEKEGLEYSFWCLNEVCNNHFPERYSKNIYEIPEWFRWKTYTDKIYDNRFRLLLVYIVACVIVFIGCLSLRD